MYVLEKHINADGKSPLYFFSGTSTDTEPSGDWLTENSQLRQNDTGVKKYYHNGAWVEMVFPGGGGGSLPDNFPTEDAANANKFVGFDENGDYTAKEAPEELPSITGKNGKILGVTLDASDNEQAEWVDAPESYPTITGKNGKVLGVTLDLSDNEQVEWVDPESPFFDVPFTHNGEAWVPTNITVAQILAAHAAGKLCRAVINLDTGVTAYGFLTLAVAESAVTFSCTLAIDESVSEYVLVGQIVPNDDDDWGYYSREFLPFYSGTDANRILSVVSDGDDGYVADWVTPQ